MTSAGCGERLIKEVTRVQLMIQEKLFVKHTHALALAGTLALLHACVRQVRWMTLARLSSLNDDAK